MVLSYHWPQCIPSDQTLKSPEPFHSLPPASARWVCLAGAGSGRRKQPPDQHLIEFRRDRREAVFLFSAAIYQKLGVNAQGKLTPPPYVSGMTLIPHAGPCPRCGGKMEFKETVGSLKTGSPVQFFQCKDCGYVHTVGDTTGSISAVPKADTSASYPHPNSPTCDVPMWLIRGRVF